MDSPEYIDDWGLSPKDIATIKRAVQDANDGLTYTLIPGSSLRFRCNPCGREADIDLSLIHIYWKLRTEHRQG